MGLPDTPVVVLVALTLATILFLIEVALPTFGIAGLSALLLAGLGLWALGEQEGAWWPLLLAGVGVSLWAVLLTTRRTALWAQVTAAGLFGVGGVSYGVLAGDAATIVLAGLGAGGLALAFRPLLRATTRLQDLPPQLGMDALVGDQGTVVRWDGDTGSVRLNGSLWTARSDTALAAGDDVEVVGYTGLTIEVALRRHRRSLTSS